MDNPSRFRADLLALDVAAGTPLALAVSGGPDSLALLLLAQAAHDGPLYAATVDHGLRAEFVSEAAQVAALCARLGVPHFLLTVQVRPAGEGLQSAARAARYAALADWCVANAIPVLATAHHADDQAETLLMRLNRGAGLAGLAAIRAERPLCPGVRLVRPVLGWRKAALAAIVTGAGITAAQDPANRDDRHDRTAIRALLDGTPLLDSARIAASARHLADSEAALAWATALVLGDRIVRDNAAVTLDPIDLPAEILRRAVVTILSLFNAVADGPAIATLIARLQAGESATLAGVKATAGRRWRFSVAPPRRNSR